MLVSKKSEDAGDHTMFRIYFIYIYLFDLGTRIKHSTWKLHRLKHQIKGADIS